MYRQNKRFYKSPYLQVCGEAFLVAETGFNQLVVKDNINTGNGSTIVTTIIIALGIFRGVGSSKNDLSFLASFVLKTKYEKFVKRLISTKINGEIMVNIKYISYIGRNFCKQCCNHFKVSFFCQCSDQ